MQRATLDALLKARRAKTPCVLLTDLDRNSQKLVLATDFDGTNDVAPEVIEAARTALRRDRSTLADGPEGAVFVHAFNPALRLVVVGAVHIAQSLVPMARLAGYAVTVVDPRQAFATDARFPDVEIRSEWPDDALAALAPDSRTAIVTLTHDPKIDDPALGAALGSEAFYIAALGSPRTHAKRVARLEDAGFAAAAIARIHAPAGLALGARSPAEIALSILAQATQTLRA